MVKAHGEKLFLCTLEFIFEEVEEYGGTVITIEWTLSIRVEPRLSSLSGDDFFIGGKYESI